MGRAGELVGDALRAGNAQTGGVPLERLACGLVDGSLAEAASSAATLATVEGLRNDSRRCRRGDLFFAVPGTRDDGARYVEQAIERGAVAIVAARDAGIEVESLGVPVLRCRNVREVQARIAHRFHAEPSRALRCFGITGTNGKTTTARLLHSILRSAGHRAAFIGTTGIVHADDRRSANQHTTPGALDLTELLAEERAAGADSVVMEVSSHALVQHRTTGVAFCAALFTQLSREHLDYHGTVERYRDAKSVLFRDLGSDAAAVVNAEDPASWNLLRGCRASVRTFGQVPGASCSARNVRETADGSRFDWCGEFGSFPVRLPLAGRYNRMNALAAGTAALARGIAAEAVQQGLESVSIVEGRLERVPGASDFDVFVDYAHTDDALEKVLRTLRPLTKGRLITVFGCGGDRDRAKRPRMGRVAERLADTVVLTSDNPRSEDPAVIADEVLRGVRRRERVELELDRRQAIECALRRARAGDVVLIAGKGHETGQVVGDRVLPFDDRRVVEEILCRC